jgi:beta-lactamase class D
MRIQYLLILIVFLASCTEEKKQKTKKEAESPISNQVTNEVIDIIIDTEGLDGAVLIYDVEGDTYYSNDFEWCNQGQLPASTFKITNSIIALESGIIENDSTLIKWDGKKQRMKIWEQDLIFRDAFHLSCVPCYQGIAKKIGVERMKEYLKKLNYGNMIVDSNNIDLFWLIGDSKISQMEQIDFLKRFYQSELPITKRTEDLMRRLMVIDKNDEYTISGKTGMVIRNGNDNAWFVGYLEKENKVYYFATNVEPKGAFDFNALARLRKEATYNTLKILRIINE